MSLLKPIITREHGSWAILLIPLFSGVSVAGSWTAATALLTLSSLGIFMSSVPLQSLIRESLGERRNREKTSASKFWALFYLGLGIVTAVPLLLQGLWGLIPIGLLAALFFVMNILLVRKYDKTAASDFVAMLGLTLTAPAASYVVTETLDARAGLLWLVHVLFFGSSMVYVHMKIRGIGVRKERFSWPEKLSIGRANVLYHVVMLAAVVLVMSVVRHPEFAGLAFFPMILHAIYGTVTLSNRVRVKQLGLLLLGQSIFFGLFISIALAGGAGWR